jgi:hypothetical protein
VYRRKFHRGRKFNAPGEVRRRFFGNILNALNPSPSHNMGDEHAGPTIVRLFQIRSPTRSSKQNKVLYMPVTVS